MAYGWPRQSRVIRRFTAEEDHEMTRLRITGASLKTIALRMGRRKSSIQLRLVALAKREEAEA